jgi:4a-hydroxytetrahydrobiopterin dehydratase
MEGFFWVFINMKMIITEAQLKKIDKVMSKEDAFIEMGNRLVRSFYFESYDDVMNFVNAVMKIAKKQNHHPDMTVHYDNVKISIFDHEKGKISDKCHKLAAAINKL